MRTHKKQTLSRRKKTSPAEQDRGAWQVLQFCHKNVLLFAILLALIPAITAQADDASPPRFENITPTTLTDESTSIAWQTTEPSTSQLFYGLTPQLGNVKEEKELRTQHELTFVSEAGKRYYYKIGGCDAQNNCGNSSIKTIDAGTPITTLKIITALPENYNQHVIDVSGRTKAFATIHAFVNNERVRVFPTSGDGKFFLRNLPLPEKTNVVRLEAWEDDQKTSQEHTVNVDTKPPAITYEKELPERISKKTFELKGEVDEPVQVFYRVIPKEDVSPPPPIQNLQATPFQNAVSLKWGESRADDFLEYAVYRDEKRIAVTKKPEYRDIGVSSDQTYRYSVSAVDTSCNEADKTSTSTTTLQGGEFVTPIIPETKLSCEPEFKTLTAGSPFSITLEFPAKINDVEVRFVDKAGNRAELKKRVIIDTDPPKIVETNLEELSPSYVPEVKIKGIVSEPASVFVFRGKDPTPLGFVVTEEDGSFEIPVSLRRENPTERERTIGLEASIGFENNLRIEAVDLAGLKSTLGPVPVVYTLCGEGSWYSVDLGMPAPAVLIPRLMLQGVQQFVIPFNISYAGGYDAQLQSIQAIPLQMSPAQAKNYDNDWITTYSQYRTIAGRDAVGIVQVQFNPFEPLPDQPNAPTIEKERALSEHRKGECVIPGMGCVKLNTILEIRFQEKIPFQRIDPRTQKVLTDFRLERRVQRVCLPIQVGIDRVIPKDAIPQRLAKNLASLFEKGIDLIDKALKPLTTITEYVTYACLGSTAWLYVQEFLGDLACIGNFDKNIARTGLCDEVYSDDVTKKKQCKTCENKLRSIMNFKTNVLHPFCDRIDCPSAPTLQQHILDNKGKATPLPQELVEKAKNAAQDFKQGKTEIKKWLVDGKLFAGNDCAFGAQLGKTPQKLVTTFTGARARPEFTLPPFITKPPILRVPGVYGIKELYDLTKGNREKLKLPKDVPSREDCEDPIRPAHPACCGFDYQRQWSSACGTGTSLGTNLDWFDELKESTCLAAQRANIPAEQMDFKCKNKWNAAAGFCSKTPFKEQPHTIPTQLFWTPTMPTADKNQVYLFVLPTRAETSIISRAFSRAFGREYSNYEVWRGFVSKTIEFRKKQTQGKEKEKQLLKGITIAEDYELAQEQGLAKEKQLTNCFREDLHKTEREQIKCFAQALCDDEVRARDGSCKTLARSYFGQVKNFVRVPDQEYIVRPENDFFTSVQCTCLPAIKGSLELWRNVFAMTNACFARIGATGAGTPGACEALLSQTVCDLLYQAINCGASWFGQEGKGERISVTFGDVLGALTRAGSRVSKSMQERYGRGPLTKALFVEKKLANSVCLWAFTGTWGLDVEALTKTTIEDMPVDSIAQLTTCRRTFAGFDPTSSPRGLTTWTYRIAGALIAGSDVRYRLKLKCSGGFNCPENPTGKCDCSQPFETIITPPELRTGQLKKFETLSFDALHTIQAKSAGSRFRYDTAILEYEYQDPKTNKIIRESTDCKIRETEGGQAPFFCSFDVGAGAFRCRLFEAPHGIKIVDIKPEYPEGQNEFLLGDQIKFLLTIAQDFPEEPGQQSEATKHLVWSVTDVSERVVKLDTTELQVPISEAGGPRAEKLQTDGTYQKQILITPKLSQEHKDDIRRHAASIARVDQDSWPKRTRPWVRELTVTKDGKAVDETVHFLIEFPNYDPSIYARMKFFVYQLSSPQRSELEGYKNIKRGTLHEGVFEPNQAQQTIEFSMQVPVALGTERWNVRMVIDRPTGFSLFDKKNFQVRASYRPARPSVDPCTAPFPRQSWNARFIILDSNKYGQPANYPEAQVSIDPATGEPQNKTTTFNIRCATKEEIEKVKVKKPEEVKQQVYEILKKSLEEEKTRLNTLKEVTARQLKDEKTRYDKLVNELLKHEQEVTATILGIIKNNPEAFDENFTQSVNSWSNNWKKEGASNKYIAKFINTTDHNLAFKILNKILNGVNTTIKAKESLSKKVAPPERAEEKPPKKKN